MKRLLLLALAATVSFSLSAQTATSKKKAAKKPAATNVTHAEEAKEIRWMSLDDVQVAMKQKPKKVFVDVYTDWCGWCKVMDKKTFSHPDVIKYINQNFYAVKLNAEQREPIRFNGSMFNFKDEYRANEFAVNLLQGRMSYPTSVIMEENFQNPQPIPGYLDVPTIEMVLKYLGEGAYKKQQFSEWQGAFKASWVALAQ
jgi:thioredoxin-related protein